MGLLEKAITRIDKKEKETAKAISHRLQFIDSARLMTSSLSILPNNFAEGIHKMKCKHGYDNLKNVKWVELNKKFLNAALDI